MTIDEKLTEVTRRAIESLDLTGAFKADHPSTLGLHVYNHDGYWTIERIRDGEVVDVYVGAPDLADALNHIAHWLRTA